MSKQEYAEYEERVRKYLEGAEAISTGPCPGCEECDPEDNGEAWFSWRACEICKTHLGGNRESWHCIIDGEIQHGTCCEDCVYYLNYGRLDDMTMLDIESSES